MSFLRTSVIDAVFTLVKVNKASYIFPVSSLKISGYFAHCAQQRNFFTARQNCSAKAKVSYWRNKMPEKVNNRTMITISVDGNISSGKSTLVSNLKELFPSAFNFQVELVPEPLEKWTNVQGHNLLGMFYDDREKNNFMFQHYVQLTRLMEEMKKSAEPSEQDLKTSGKVRILERSLQNNRYCFTELARREGNLKPEEFAVLSEWHSWLDKQFDLTLDAIVYLRTDPQTVFDRMQHRGRSEESSVPIDYLKNLHETYENWLIRSKIESPINKSVPKPEDQQEIAYKTPTSTNQRVIVIDGNQSIEDVAEECKIRLKEFMKELTQIDKKYQRGVKRKIDMPSDVDASA